jgi:DNA helicase II / ATP-dependent DNA helicase PcrA
MNNAVPLPRQRRTRSSSRHPAREKQRSRRNVTASAVSFDTHLAAGVCTHEEIRAVLRGVFRNDELRSIVAEYLRRTTSALIVDEVFDANDLDVALILLAGSSGIPTTLIGDPWQALYEFRGAQPELVPKLVETQGYETCPVTRSFRFTTPEMQQLAAELRTGGRGCPSSRVGKRR